MFSTRACEGRQRCFCARTCEGTKSRPTKCRKVIARAANICFSYSTIKKVSSSLSRLYFNGGSVIFTVELEMLTLFSDKFILIGDDCCKLGKCVLLDVVGSSWICCIFDVADDDIEDAIFILPCLLSATTYDSATLVDFHPPAHNLRSKSDRSNSK